MSGEIKEIISIIKEKYPDASEGEIKKAIIDCVNSSLSEIVAEIELSSLKELKISSRKEMYLQARSRVKWERLQEDKTKAELIHTFMTIQEDSSNMGMREDANRFTKHIKDIEEASFTKKQTLMYADSDLSEMIKREETAEEDRDRTIGKLEELREDANE